jgi:CheY-like chemotaxis protein
VLNDVLDISKIEAGAIELVDGVVDLEQLALAAQSTFSSLAGEKDLHLRVEIDPEVRGLWRGDPSRIRQILHNLLGNAVKFTQQGWVEIAMGRQGAWITMTITDTGPGIPKERQAQVFDRFAQADASTTRRFGGTGLGLAICRELAVLMGGDIALRSIVDRGSAFTVRLPLQRAEQPQPARPSLAALSEGPSKGLRILAAEDNATNQLVLKTLLGQLGLELDFVENGAQAVEAWENARWDVILMDVQMPVMDGPTATAVIRAREQERGLAPVPIIALTANAMSHHAEEYRRAGMDALVPKPINLGELVEAIQHAVEAPPAQQRRKRMAARA